MCKDTQTPNKINVVLSLTPEQYAFCLNEAARIEKSVEELLVLVISTTMALKPVMKGW